MWSLYMYLIIRPWANLLTSLTLCLLKKFFLKVQIQTKETQNIFWKKNNEGEQDLPDIKIYRPFTIMLRLVQKNQHRE